MTEPEFRQADLELQGMISHYEADTCQKKAEIALNDKAIVDLKFKREKLRKDYEGSEDIRNIIPE